MDMQTAAYVIAIIAAVIGPAFFWGRLAAKVDDLSEAVIEVNRRLVNIESVLERRKRQKKAPAAA